MCLCLCAEQDATHSLYGQKVRHDSVGYAIMIPELPQLDDSSVEYSTDAMLMHQLLSQIYDLPGEVEKDL